MEEWIVLCPNCGKEITGNAKFCPYCGAQFSAGSASEDPAGSAAENPVGSATENPAESATQALAGSATEDAAGSVSENPAGAAPETSVDSALSEPEISTASAPETAADFVPPAPEAPAYTVPMGAESFGASAALADDGKKRPGAGLIIGGAVIVVLVLALAVAAVSGLFSSPKDQLTKALEKTFAAYADAREGLGLPDLSQSLLYDSCSRRFSLSVDSIGQEVTSYYPELSALRGLGVRVDTDFDRESRKADAGLAVFWNEQDLLSFQILLDDNKLYLASPDLTGGEAYGFNTETFGADLIKLGAVEDESDLGGISFNLFDLPEEFASDGVRNREMAEAGAEAGRRLLDAIEAEKGGKESIDVNGSSVDATVYHVVVPGAAMHDYLDALQDIVDTVYTVDVMEDLLGSMGLGEGALQETGAADPFGYVMLIRELRDAADSIGDLELDVYVSGGYVSAVEYAGRVNGAGIGIGLYLGGGANYVDDWSLEIEIDGEKLTVESTGDHGARSGVFTDETTIRLDSSRLTSVLRYEPRAFHDNFEWKIKLDNSASVAVEGQLTLTEKSLDLKIDELSLQSAWSRLLTLKGALCLGPCEGMQVSFASPKLLADMSENERIDLYFGIIQNADAWSYDVLDRIPPEALDSLY